MNFIIEHGQDIVTGLLGLVAFCSMIANFTKTDIDNKAVGWFAKIINLLAINIKTTGLK